MGDDRLTLSVGDITTLEVDAIVNAANSALTQGGGVCGAIFRAAGPELANACMHVAPCPTGEARITLGFRVPARWIVHAVGPMWQGGTKNQDGLLAAAYNAALEIAASVHARTIAFPSISTGIYGFPIERAAPIAVRAVREWIATHAEPASVHFRLFSESDADVYRRIVDGGPEQTPA